MSEIKKILSDKEKIEAECTGCDSQFARVMIEVWGNMPLRILQTNLTVLAERHEEMRPNHKVTITVYQAPHAE